MAFLSVFPHKKSKFKIYIGKPEFYPKNATTPPKKNKKRRNKEMMIEKFLEEYCNEESVLLSQRIAIRRFFAIVNEIKERNIKNKSAILYIINDVYGMTETDFNKLLDAMQYVSETLKKKSNNVEEERWVKRV